MRVCYVVLYVKDSEACKKFWTEKVGMQVKETTKVELNTVYRVGFSDQNFSFELVPLDLMKENPHGLDLATPSICFYVDDIPALHKQLTDSGVTTTEITLHADKANFAFCDNEDRWFAVLEDK